MKFCVFVLGALIIGLAKPSLQASTPSSPTYKAAVIEYHAVSDNKDGTKAANANANHYKKIIIRAAKENVDIIIFPEYGLTSIPQKRKLNATEYRDYFKNVASYAPHPSSRAYICSDKKFKESLRNMACAAREFKTYIVVNHFEREDCNNCSVKYVLYNSNFVFDREGRLIQRYRKFNLYDEAGTNITKLPEIGTFKTDFNVTFGQIICADIIRQRPAMSYVQNPNITDVIMTTHWFDQRPFFQALGVQAGYAYVADVNLLVSGFNNPNTGTTGTGVFAGKNGPLVTYRKTENVNAIIVAEVTKKNRRDRPFETLNVSKPYIIELTPEDVPTFVPPLPTAPRLPAIYTQMNMRLLETRLVNLESNQPHIDTVCNRDICCEFHVKTTYDRHLAERPGVSWYRYRMAVFNGILPVVNETSMGVEICSLLACIGPEIKDCSVDFPPNSYIVKPVRIEELVITRQGVDTRNHSLYVPIALDRNSMPLNGTDFGYVQSGHKHSSMVLMFLTRPRDDIQVFGIVGRKYQKDGSPLTSFAMLFIPSALLIALTIFLSAFIRVF